MPHYLLNRRNKMEDTVTTIISNVRYSARVAEMLRIVQLINDLPKNEDGTLQITGNELCGVILDSRNDE